MAVEQFLHVCSVVVNIHIYLFTKEMSYQAVVQRQGLLTILDAVDINYF